MRLLLTSSSLRKTVTKERKCASAAGFMLGDMLGAPFEGLGKSEAGQGFLRKVGSYTDDTLMYLSVLHACAKRTDLCRTLIQYYDQSRGYGGRMSRMLSRKQCVPSDSFGNGAATRSAAVALFESATEKDAVIYAKKTHTHPDSLAASRAVYWAVRAALQGSKDLSRSWEILGEKKEFDDYSLSLHSMESIPPALIAFETSGSFVSALRTAITGGGDTDSIGAVAGALAGAYYGIPETMLKYLEKEKKMTRLLLWYCP